MEVVYNTSGDDSVKETGYFVSPRSSRQRPFKVKEEMASIEIEEALSKEYSASPVTLKDSESTGPISKDDGDDDDDERVAEASQASSSSRCLGWIQTMALTRKSMLSKMRTPTATFFEIFSPVLMMLILLAAYTLAENRYRDPGIYSDIRFDIPGPWFALLTGSASVASGMITSRRNLVQETPDNDRFLEPIKINFLNHHKKRQHDWDLESSLVEVDDSSTINGFRDRQLQTEVDDDVLEDANTTISSDPDNVFELLSDARRQLNRILESPIPVPTFDQYVSISTGISSLISPDDLPDILSDSSYGREWGNILTLGTLHLTPNNDLASEFWTFLNATYPAVMNTSQVNVRIHDREKDALKFINDNLDERTWALLDFSSSQEMEDFRYKIRMNYTTLPNTNQITDFVSIGLNTLYQRYYLSGYLTIQRTLNAFSFSRIEIDEDDQVCADAQQDASNLWSMPMPTAAYSQNNFFQAVGFLLGATIAMAFMYPMSRLVKSMVEEKETRMKETLFILGVRPWAHWLSWIITSVVIFLIITILVTFTLGSGVLKYSSSLYLFSFIGLFSSATMGFSFFISAFFSRAKLAAVIGPVALFATLLPRFIFFGSNRYEATTTKMLASLLPCTAFAFGADIVADYEYAEQGVQPYNAGEGDYSFNTALGFLFIDTILYMVLGWYLELVIPRQYGVPRKWYFVVTPKYWCDILSCFFPRSRSRSPREDSCDGGSSAASTSTNEEESSPDYELVSDPSLIARVEINDLVKRYSKTSDVPPAVDKLNLKMYESQITCLLGHNGAGKTSTISVLTGLYPPTSGDCNIYGKSIVHDLNEARQSMGICPQHNVLFDMLTVTEHLALFERIKGIRPNRSGVRERASEIGLGEYFNTKSSALSGGNKRKLSLAIALCGDPTFVILDEPTSGMDVASRRACWELLRKKREGRVTLLTTHFMDEAELLSDRIAVMKEGRLQCCGSSLFLKNRFGLGYNLTVVLDRGVQQRTTAYDTVDGLELGISPTASDVNRRVAVDPNAVNRILTFLKNLIPDTELVRSSAREIAYRFPQGTEDLFPAVFDALEENRGALGIGAYGITNTTLEEVFLQLAEEQDDKPEKSCSREEGRVTSLRAEQPPSHHVNQSLGEVVSEKQPSRLLRWIGTLRHMRTTISKPTNRKTDKVNLLSEKRQRSDYNSTPEVSEMELEHMGSLRQVRLLYMKRFTIQKRDTKGFFFTVLIPVVLIALVLLVLTIDLQIAGPAIELNMDLYDTSPGGSSARTNVLVGGGASSSNSSESVFESYDRVRTQLERKYDHAEFELVGDKQTSRQVSEFLLETIHDRSHNARYGAFVFDDAINVTVKIDRSALRRDVENLQSVSFGGEVIDVLSLWTTDQDASRPVQFNISIADLSSVLFSSTNLTNQTSLNVSDLERTTSTALLDLVDSASDAEAALSWVDAVADLVRIFNSTEDTFTFFQVLVEASSDGAIDTSDAPALVEALQALTGGSAFESIILISRLITPVDFFSRDAVAMAYESIIIDVLGLLSVESANATSLVDATFRNINETTPNTLLVIPIIVADTRFEETLMEDENATITIGDALGMSSVFLGGDSERLDGAVLVTVRSIVLDPSTMLTTVSLSVEANSGVIFDDNVTLTVEDISSLLALLPEGTSEVTTSVNTDVSIIHNATSPHSAASFNQAYMEYLYKRCSGNDAAQLTSVNHPLPLTTQQSLEIRTILSVLASLFILIPFCYILGAFIVFPVKERVCKSKHLQLVGGVNMSAYWVATYLWDLTLFGVLAVAVMVVFVIYGQESAEVFVGSLESFFATMLLTFGYGMSALPFSYLLSRLFDNHSSAQIAVMGIFFITGFVAVNAYYIMITIESTQDLAETLLPLFRVWPAYNVGEGFIRLSAAFFEREILGEESYPLDWDVAGRNIGLCFLLSIPYFIWLLLLEYSADGGSGGFLGRMLRIWRGSYEGMLLKWNGVRKSPDGSLLLDDGLVGDDASGHGNSQQDQDVAHERKYVLERKEELRGNASVLLVNLWKVYPSSVGMFGICIASIRRVLSCIFCCFCFRRQANQQDDDEDKSNLPKRAIRGLTTAIHEGETYGLLGVNGAGKTTTMGVLTGDITATGGEAYVAGHDVTGAVAGGVSEARKNIGFCPQVDPLLDLMTARETLTMFGRLRGIPEEYLYDTVNNLMNRLTLTPHADKVAESYSGGNKRKLSLGIALIGNPRVLFIDESSSGMDPAARRHIWSLVEEVSQNRSVILTTHSMEEAEALCTRVGIMVHGRLLCLGSVQHLKTTYLDGYTIDVHCVRGTPNHVVDTVQEEILNNALPGSRLSERHGPMLRFDVGSLSKLGLGTTFGRLQQLKQNPEMRVENYSISQCSLEQVFISLVRKEEEEGGCEHVEENEEEESQLEGTLAEF